MVYRDPSKRYYSEAEAADYLGITKRMLARRRYQKKIDHIKDGHLILYELRHLDAYLSRFSTAPTPEPQPDLTDAEEWYSALRSKKGERRSSPSAKLTKQEPQKRRALRKRTSGPALMDLILQRPSNDS